MLFCVLREVMAPEIVFLERSSFVLVDQVGPIRGEETTQTKKNKNTLAIISHAAFVNKIILLQSDRRNKVVSSCVIVFIN